MIKNDYAYKDIISELKNKIYHPVYFLAGEEPYFIDKITEFMLADILPEEERSFNLTLLYGEDTNARTIINACKRYPMMGSLQMVVVKEAQELKDIDDLVYYLEQPLASTILVVNFKYKVPDKRKKLFKVLKEKAVYFESKKLYEDKIPQWISDQLKRNNKRIEPKAAALLTEFLGNDLLKIEKELEKLLIILPDNLSIITSALIEKNIGVSKEYNSFELQNALINRDIVKANRIIRYFASNPKKNSMPQVLAGLYYFFSRVLLLHRLKTTPGANPASALKVHPYFVKDYQKAANIFNTGKTIKIISYLREADVKSKGYGNTSAGEGELLKELIYKIMH
jgi:DNA polymerase-3 subunit delta